MEFRRLLFRSAEAKRVSMPNSQNEPLGHSYIHNLLQSAFTDNPYDQGFKDAIETMALALMANGVSQEAIRAAAIEACDAFANNHDEVPENTPVAKPAG